MLMNSDIRIDVGFPNHHKTIKLSRKLGDKAVICLIRLWCYSARHKPTGILCGLENIDIAIASGWDGDEDEWVSTLCDIGWCENLDGTIHLHDWEKHNPYAFHAEDRSEQARKAASARWTAGGEKKSSGKKTRSERLADARKKGRHTKQDWEKIVSFFNGECVRCGSTETWSIVKDHITPIYQGGSDGVGNLQPLCAKCNASKGHETIDHRVTWCESHGVEMPKEWLLSETETPAECLQTPAVMPSPSPSPSPSPIPSPTPISSVSNNTGASATENEYAFNGRVIKLKASDFDAWKSTYHTLDLRAALMKIDAYLSQNGGDNWFFRASNWLEKDHQKALQARKSNEPSGDTIEKISAVLGASNRQTAIDLINAAKSEEKALDVIEDAKQSDDPVIFVLRWIGKQYTRTPELFMHMDAKYRPITPAVF